MHESLNMLPRSAYHTLHTPGNMIVMARTAAVHDANER